MSFTIFPTLGFPVIARDNMLIKPIITPNTANTAPAIGAAVGTTGNDLSSLSVPDITLNSN